MNSTTTVFVKDFKIEMSIGIHDFEKNKKQPVIFNVETLLQENLSFSNDEVGETFNYEQIVETIEQTCQLKHFALLEHLAEYVATKLLKHEVVQRVDITIKKPDIFKSKGIENVGIRYTRTMN